MSASIHPQLRRPHRHQPTTVAVTALALILVANLIQCTSSFSVLQQASLISSSSSSTRLGMGKVKRGKLASSIELDAPVKRTRNKNKRKANTKKASIKTAKGATGAISPALAEWMEKQESNDDSSAASVTDQDDTETSEIDVEVDDGLTFASFKDEKKKPSTRRKKQSERMAAEQARQDKVQQLVEQIETAIEDGDSKDLYSSISGPVRELLRIPSGNLRQLTAGAKSINYRLVWVGSDDAICHVGTGLHKVPLARLQEVFLTVGGRSRVEIQEVIRVIGPFPNVKNVLQGKSSVSSASGIGDSGVVGWQLAYDSMIDGAGKELLAGTEENTRIVDLQVHFADPSIIVAVVPPSPDNLSLVRGDPLEDNGENALIFVRDDDMDDKLDKLRVA